jgi:hypothetical protein
MTELDKEARKEQMLEQHEAFLQETGGYLDYNQEFLPGDVVAEHLDITEKMLTTLAASGEFNLGRIAGRIIVDKKSLLAYLDRNHFTAKVSEDDPSAIDSRGKVKSNLTYVKKKHTELPRLRKATDFNIRLPQPLEERSFIRHCEIGTFTHYRISTMYKMSEEDYLESLRRITQTGLKSNRGSLPGRKKKSKKSK